MPGFAAEIRPLRHLEPATATVCGLTLLALLVANVHWAVRLALLATFAVAAVALRRELRRTATVRTLTWDGEERWHWNGTPVTVAPGTRVHPGLVVLVLGGAGRAVHWIPRAAVEPDAFRRLKAALRHGASKTAGESPC
jgi:hypothetical protein